MNSWEKIKIKSDSGDEIEAVAPIVISASRSTDIPAFYADWFMNKLDQGYVKWINPFNQRPQFISFTKARAVIFWTKNAKPLMKYLTKIDNKKLNYYFQFTINDYEDDGLEPNLPKLRDRILTFKSLSEKIGKNKVIWRFDPIILSESIDIKKVIEKIYRVGKELHQFTNKLVISFVDIEKYLKVKRNLKNIDFPYKEIHEDQMKNIAEQLELMNKEWRLEIGTCAEKVELSKFGIVHNKCIDDDLMRKFFPHDLELLRFLGIKADHQTSLFEASKREKKLKDPGQRRECGCIVSKDIGQYNTCPHLCVYCYANYSAKTVNKNFKKHKIENSSII